MTAETTIPSLLFSAAERSGSRVAFNHLRDSWHSVSYAELALQVRRAMNLFAAAGIARGDRVALIAENRPAWCTAYLAAVSLGAVAVPLDAQLTESQARVLLADSGSKVVLHSTGTAASAGSALTDGALQRINLDTLDALTGTPPDRPAEISPGDTASLIYTSGTTGQPKGVMLSHLNICADARALISADLISEKDNVLAVLPFHHTYPFMCTFLVPLFIGAAVTFSPSIKASDIAATIRDKGITAVVAVPRLLEMIRNGITARMRQKRALFPLLSALMEFSGIVRSSCDLNPGKRLFAPLHRNFPRLRFFASGGARLEPAVMEDLEALGFTVLEGYGLTETSPVVTFNPPQRRKPGSAGKPLPSVELMIADDGEIMVRGPMVMQGYYRNPVATAEVMREGWFSTGDTGSLDREGYLFITGRKKEVIVLSSGKNVYPEEVEKLYLAAPIIREICIVAKDGALHGVVVPDLDYAKRGGISNVAAETKWQIQGISMTLPPHLRVGGCTVVTGPLPRTPLGKLRRFMVRDLLRAPERGQESPDATEASLLADDLGRSVVECLRELLSQGTALRAQDNLELDLGFDSLRRIEFISALEQTFTVTLPESLLVDAQTVADVIAALRPHVGGPVQADARPPGWRDILDRELSAADAGSVAFNGSGLSQAVLRSLFSFHGLFFRLFFRLKAEGTGNIPSRGAFIITPNHASHLDGFAVAAAIPFSVFHRLYFIGLQRFFTGPLRSRLARASHIIPIDPETNFSRSLQVSAHVLRQGRGLCVFPEGARSFDGTVQPFKKGTAILAAELGVPLVPAYISGTFSALPRGARFIKPSRVTVAFGPPFTASDLGIPAEIAESEGYQLLAERLRERVLALGSLDKR